MSLKQKVCWVAVIAVAIYAGADIVVQHFIIRPGFLDLERQQANRNAKRCTEAMDREIHYLDKLCNDWASWDDMYAFVRDRNKAFITANLNEATFEVNNLDVFVTTDLDGRIVWANPLRPGSQLPATPEHLGAWVGESATQLLAVAKTGTPVKGIVSTEAGLMMVAARPILASDAKGPPRGTLTMGRLLTSGTIASLAEQTCLDLRLLPIPAGGPTAEQAAVLSQVTSNNPHPALWHDAKTLAICANLADIGGRPVAIVEVRVPRDIVDVGYEMGRCLMLAILASTAMMLVLILGLLQRTILRPVSRLTQYVIAIRRGGTVSRPCFGRDEIEVLASEFDQSFRDLHRRDCLLAGVAEAAHHLLGSSDLDRALEQVVQVLGPAADVDRVHIFQNHPEPLSGQPMMSLCWEWVREGISSRMGDPLWQSLPFAQHYQDWYETLSSGRPIRAVVADLPEPKRKLLAGITASLLLMPIRVEGVLWGMIGFHDRRLRRWDDMEASILMATASNIGSALIRRAAQQSLQQSETRFRSITSAARDAVIMMDDQGRISLWNDAAASMFGYLADEAIGRSLHSLIAPEAYQAICQTGLDRFWRTGQGSAMGNLAELQGRRKDGTEFPVELSLAPVRIADRWHAVGILRDISERKRVENELRAATRLQQKIIDTAATAVFMVDPQMRITEVNKAFCSATGYRPDEVIGRQCRTLQSSTCGEVCTLFDPHRTEAIFHRQCQILAKDGRRLTVFKNADVIRDKDGRITGCIESFVDVTELAAAREAAERANAAKSAFLARMSHEIRTPLNGVIGMTHLLTGTTLTAQQQHYAEVIRSCGESLLMLINDILDLSKIEAGKFELHASEFDPCVLVEDVAEMFSQRAAQKQVELATIIDPAVPRTMRGDADRLRQVLINLVGNALKFTDQGEVIVRAIPERGDDGRAMLHLSVSDTGIGISEQGRQRLFKTFSQVDTSSTRKYGGTGLGLAICKRLVELMGGRIGVESRQGCGSTFWFTVSLQECPVQSMPDPHAKVDLRRLRVLGVDDNGASRQVLAEQLASWHFAAEVVADGQTALQRLREATACREPFDVVIIDAQMPGISGLELAAVIHSDAAIHPATRIIMTLVDAPLTAEQMRQAGVAYCITKPVRQSRLFDGIAEAVARGRGAAAAPTRASLPPATPRGRSVGARILLAEDNEVNQELAAEVLRGAGYQCDVVPNGLAAVSAVMRSKYDLVLMDCQMPEMDGLEATRSIRQKEAAGIVLCGSAPRLPIVALTANAIGGERERCLEAGMDGYVSKPICPADLVQAIETQLSRRTGAAEPVGCCESTPEGDPADAGKPPFALDELLARCMGNGVFMTAILGKFRQTVAEDLEKLHRAIRDGNVPDATRLAHTIKGSAGNMAAHAVQTAASELERICREGNLVGVEEVLARLARQIGRCQESVPGIIASLAAEQSAT